MSLNDAGRVITVVRGIIEENTESGAGIEVTYGQVDSIDANGDLLIYLAGSREMAEAEGDTADPSEGFRIHPLLHVEPDDIVRVSIDRRGHRWVDEVLLQTAYPRFQVDVNTGKVYVGDGTTVPLPAEEPGQFLTSTSLGSMSWTTPSDLSFVPFMYNGIGANVSNQEMPPLGTAMQGTTGQGIVIPWSFSVVGISIHTETPRTTGTLTARARINGVDTGVTAQLNGTNTKSAVGEEVVGSTANQGTSGQMIGMTLTTSGWAPTTGIIYGGIWIVSNRFKESFTRTGSFTADAVLRAAGGTTTFTADAVLRKVGIAGTFTADAVLAAAGGPPLGFTARVGRAESKGSRILPGIGA